MKTLATELYVIQIQHLTPAKNQFPTTFYNGFSNIDEVYLVGQKPSEIYHSAESGECILLAHLYIDLIFAQKESQRIATNHNARCKEDQKVSTCVVTLEFALNKLKSFYDKEHK